MADKDKLDSGQLLIYQDGRLRLQVRLEGETVWLSQRAMAELFQSSVPNINQHLTAIYDEGELHPEATIKKYLIVQTEGSRNISRQIDHYNLDAIIAVGYRVKSPIATRFRQWATARLSEYIVKGFTLDDERLKGTGKLADYFDELLARIRDIRASEARVYQRIREIFALASDYHPEETDTQTFFATVQNKMHFAATGMTAAEIVRRRADAEKPNMGLTSWKGGVVRKQDARIAKNYLDPVEIDILNRITVMFLDQAEFRAKRRQDIRMRDWEGFLDKFLADTDLPILDHAGTVSHEEAEQWSYRQYDAFEERRRQEAEAAAELRYIEDLQATAKTAATKREKGKGKGASRGEN